jgi:hypothetical protein
MSRARLALGDALARSHGQGNQHQESSHKSLHLRVLLGLLLSEEIWLISESTRSQKRSSATGSNLRNSRQSDSLMTKGHQAAASRLLFRAELEIRRSLDKFPLKHGDLRDFRG